MDSLVQTPGKNDEAAGNRLRTCILFLQNLKQLAKEVQFMNQREQGRVNPFIPKRFRERQYPFDEKLRSDLEGGKVGLGKSTGRKNPPHLQQIGGSQKKMARTTTSRMARSTIKRMSRTSSQAQIAWHRRTFSSCCAHVAHRQRTRVGSRTCGLFSKVSRSSHVAWNFA